MADFGVAKVTEATSSTEPGSLVGSVHYLSPEQAAGRTLTPRSDLYSLGIVLYEMLSGTRPFEAENWEEGPLAVADKRLKEDPEPLGDQAPDVPPWLEQTTMRLLARDPNERFTDAAELTEVLRGELGIPEGPPDKPDMQASPTQLDLDEPLPEAAPSAPPDKDRELRTLPSTGTSSRVRAKRRKRRGVAIVVMMAALAISVVLVLVGTAVDRPEVRPPEASGTPADQRAVTIQKAVTVQDAVPIQDVVSVRGGADPGGDGGPPASPSPSPSDPGYPISLEATSPQGDQYR